MKTFILLFLATFSLSTLQAADNIMNDSNPDYSVLNAFNENSAGFDNIDFPRLRIAVYGGLSGLTNEMLDQGSSSFYNDLRSGKSLGLDIQYYILKPIGVGIKYSAFRSKASQAQQTMPYNTVEGDLSIKFVGPVVSGRFLHFNDRNSVFVNLGYGYADYKLVTQSGIDHTVKGNAMAAVYELGYELGISQKFAFFLQSSYLSGNMKKIESTYAGNMSTINLPKENYESLNRFDFSVGLRFNL